MVLRIENKPKRSTVVRTVASWPWAMATPLIRPHDIPTKDGIIWTLGKKKLELS